MEHLKKVPLQDSNWGSLYLYSAGKLPVANRHMTHVQYAVKFSVHA